VLFDRATENSDTDKTGTATVTLSISDVAEFAATSLTACMANQSPSGICALFFNKKYKYHVLKIFIQLFT